MIDKWIFCVFFWLYNEIFVCGDVIVCYIFYDFFIGNVY